ncbi:SusC/RagA family TonB-linked outer membrane protein [Saccharicrinis aurantiacus]|uniref:SusC/RagA family TonB-linked outer membrane protein n=1 Tax=Saccharicrinis aurantiacus TaxID=1849719 RepID=UPI002492AB6F|nr:SusC/RagA family TonB-linked outer membrane protein [Saccharicrinis aurantiacus]
MKKEITLIWICLVFSVSIIAQNKIIVSGKVSEEGGGAIPGVTVMTVGAGNGGITDFDGNYSIEAGASDTLQFSFIGFETKLVPINGNIHHNVILGESFSMVEEVVVVGYGEMKVKDLTSAITTVKSDVISSSSTSQAMQSLQGKVAGLQITSAGAPGESPNVRIRGVGSFPGVGDGNPLYVVDGVFFDDIGFLNTNDIESMTVLKDASASAIYGVRAANGVVLVETKSGTKGKGQITYDGYYGIQRAQNVLEMANTDQYISFIDDAGLFAQKVSIRNAINRYGANPNNASRPNVDTDWYNELLRLAPMQNHSLSFSGGNDKATYSTGINFFNQEGILDMPNSFQRVNLRGKFDFEVNNWLKVGSNVMASTSKREKDNPSAWDQAYYAVPILPVYDEHSSDAFPLNLGSARNIGYRNDQNPFTATNFYEGLFEEKKFVVSTFLDASIIKDKLKFRTMYSIDHAALEDRNASHSYSLIDLTDDNRDDFSAPLNSLSKSFQNFDNTTWDNTLTYTDNVGNSSFTIMAGTSYRQEKRSLLFGSASNVPLDDLATWYLNLATNKNELGYGDDGYRYENMSYFGRFSYSYKSKYLLYGTVRADGTSKFQEQWGYFPTVGAGWVISEESFMNNINALDYLKIRGSWGQLGNNKVNPSDGARSLSVIQGIFDGQFIPGFTTSNTFEWLDWEVNEVSNIGISANFLRNRLSLELDYFKRLTKNAIIPVSLPVIGGSIRKNVGTIQNKGLEVVLNWSDKVNDNFSYSIGGNVSTLDNQVTDLYGEPYLDGGETEFQQRSVVGQPIMSFFGYQVEGVYQTQAEINNDPIARSNGLAPGDLKFKDQDNNGVIDGDDRVFLGSPIPTLTYGVDLSIQYKRWDLAASVIGQMGNKILNRKRGNIIWTSDVNIDADLAKNVWNGEGTSNSYPSAAGLYRGWNQNMSSFFVEDGSFFRIQNVRLGYDFNNMNIGGVDLPDMKFTLSAERPLTLFGYNGFTPEVDNGVDKTTYPVPAIYTVGVNIKF